MDLLKAFDYVPHDLLIAKLAVYSVDEKLLMYIYSCLSNRKQCVRINNVHSSFQNVVSGVHQGSIVGRTLFNCFFNDFFYFIDKTSVHNFTDDNSLSAFEPNIENLKLILESESKKAISWFQSKKMIVNSGKFQGIIIDKKKQNHTSGYISIDQKNIKTASSVKLLGVHIDDKLNFNLHITKICRSAANHLDTLIRLRMFLNFKEKKTLINSYFYSNFIYSSLVWIFSSAKPLNKVESLKKRALCFLYEDYVSWYEEISQKAGKETMKINRLRSLCIEIYKSINNINPMYMDEKFKLRKTSRVVRSNYNLDVPTTTQISLGDKSLTYCRPKIWNSFHITSSENLEAFKNIIKNWNGVSCKCRVCQYH